MADLIVTGRSSGSRGEERGGHRLAAAWGPVAVGGIACAAAAAADTGLHLVPIGFGDALWEAAAMIAALDRLPLIVLGVALVAGAAVAQARRRVLLAVAVTSLVLAIVAAFAGILATTAVPRVLAMAQDTPNLGELRRGATRAAMEAAACGAAALWIAWRTWQHHKKL